MVLDNYYHNNKVNDVQSREYFLFITRVAASLFLFTINEKSVVLL